MARWPHDDPRSLAAFYGNPASGEPGRQLVPVVPPFRMTCDGKPIKAIQFHKKAASALLAALNEIWEHYGRDQARIDAAGVSRYAGAYNPRLIRGRATRWSNHAYGRRSTSTPSGLASIPATAPCRRRWSTPSSVWARYGGTGARTRCISNSDVQADAYSDAAGDDEQPISDVPDNVRHWGLPL